MLIPVSRFAFGWMAALFVLLARCGGVAARFRRATLNLCHRRLLHRRLLRRSATVSTRSVSS